MTKFEKLRLMAKLKQLRIERDAIQDPFIKLKLAQQVQQLRVQLGWAVPSLDDYIAKYDTLAKATKAYFDDHLKGKVFDTVIGKVHILGSSWQKKLKAGINTDSLKAKAIPSIPEILINGTYDGKENLTKVRPDDFIAFHAFSKNIKIDGKDTFVRLLVGERENKQFEFVVYSIYPNAKNSDDSNPRSTWASSELLGSIALTNKE